MPIPSRLHLAALAAAGLALVAACNLTFVSVAPSPSPWALTWPDAAPLTTGRVVRFAGSYGLGGPSPALMFRQQGGVVSGEMLVWYPAFEPIDAGHRPPADSAAEWGRMQGAMQAQRAHMDSLYGCTAWARGAQDGPAWVCRVPELHGHPNWTAELHRLDSLIQARPASGAAGPRRVGRDTTAAGRRQVSGGVSGCMDGGSWSIVVRDSTGDRVVAPPPSPTCPRPDGPGKRYEDGGWKMLREFIAAVKP